MKHILEAIGFFLLIMISKILPFKFLYIFSDILIFFLEHIVRYRKKVIIKNLKLAFPEYDDKKIKRLVHKTYKNLGDTFLERIKVFSVSKSTIKKKYIIKNDEVIKEINESKQSVLAICGHYANWEWFPFICKDYFNLDIYVVYKPMSNKIINRIIKNNREQDGFKVVPMEKTAYLLKKSLTKPIMVGLIADQNPSSDKKIIWANFFNIRTAVIDGPENFARKFNMPVYYYEVNRVKRGHYHLKFIPLCLNPANTKKGEITSVFMSYLENTIRQKPEDYLWSHKRWKKTFPTLYQ